MGLEDRAIEQYARAEDLDRELAVTQLYWAATLIQSGALGEAAYRIRRTHELAPELAESYVLMSLIAENMVGSDATELSETLSNKARFLRWKHYDQAILKAL